jgi:hypothetical protein
VLSDATKQVEANHASMSDVTFIWVSHTGLAAREHLQRPVFIHLM